MTTIYSATASSLTMALRTQCVLLHISPHSSTAATRICTKVFGVISHSDDGNLQTDSIWQTSRHCKTGSQYYRTYSCLYSFGRWPLHDEISLFSVGRPRYGRFCVSNGPSVVYVLLLFSVEHNTSFRIRIIFLSLQTGRWTGIDSRLICIAQ